MGEKREMGGGNETLKLTAVNHQKWESENSVFGSGI